MHAFFLAILFAVVIGAGFWTVLEPVHKSSTDAFRSAAYSSPPKDWVRN